MISVNTVTLGYYSVQESLYPHLKPIERNCLHIIFERLRVADEQMDGMEKAFMRAVKDKVLADPWSVFAGRCEELLASYDVVAELATSYLAGKPIDVFAK
jgi:phytoene/squalene synthetase